MKSRGAPSTSLAKKPSPLQALGSVAMTDDAGGAETLHGRPPREAVDRGGTFYLRAGMFLQWLRRAADQTGDAHYQTFDIDGRRVRVFGNPGDSYFDGTLRASISRFLTDKLRLKVSGWSSARTFLAGISKKLPSDAVIFDVGANIGVTTAIFAAAHPERRVYCFEPSPRAFEHLSRTISENGLSNCTRMQVALGAAPGFVGFMDNPQSASASHLAVEGVTLGGGSISVEVATLDEMVSRLNLTRLDFIKIDVEGFEADVIQGAQQTIKRLRPSVFLEFNSFTLIAFRNMNPRALLERVLELFPFVYAYDGSRAYQLDTPAAVLTFIHDNLLKRGCVDDLYCSFSSIA